MKETTANKRTLLKALKIKGFKSFARSTTILFSPGISAIVGPNGCGKSNVVDAIKWVLGEQGYKPLRSKTAADLIFSGTDHLGPASMAEVSIILEQEDNSSSSEFMLTRRIFRSGETGYLINKRPCRLKDIKETLLNLGLGLKSYGIIEQGQVTELIEFSPLEKRRLLEEAAGITKYREKKEETLRKLEDTKQNLVRLEDILKEVERQVRRLAQQAKRAKEYLELKEKLRQIEISLLLQRYKSKREAWEKRQKEAIQLREENSTLLSTQTNLSRRLKELKYQVFALQEQLKAKEKSLWETRTRLKELELKQKGLDEKEEAAKKRKRQLKELCQRLEAEKEEIKKQRAEVEKELAQLASQLQTLQKEGQTVKAVVAELESILNENRRLFKEKKQEQEKMKQRLIRTETELEHLQRQKRRLEEDKKGIAAKLRQKVDQAQKAEAELKRIYEQLEGLEKEINKISIKKKEAENVYERTLKRHRRWQKATLNLEEVLMRQRSQLKTIEQGLKAHQPKERLKEVRGQVMDILAEVKGYEDAVEAVLRFKANNGWLVPDLDTGLRFFKENKGQTLVPLDLKTEKHSLKTALTHYPLPIGTPLLEKIRFKPEYEEVGKRLFAQVVLVERLEAELLSYDDYLFVTPRGEILTKEGILHKKPTQGVLKEYLEKQQKKAWLQKTIKVLEAKLPQLKAISERLKGQLKQQEAFVKEAEKEIKRLDKERQRLKAEEIRQREFLKYALLQREEIEKRQVKIEEEWSRLQQQQTEQEKERQILREQNGQLREELRRLREKLKKIERLRNEKKELLSRYHWQRQEGEKKRIFLLKERQRLERREEECERELKQTLKESEELTAEMESFFQERETLKRDLVACKEKLEEIEGIIELRKRELEASLKEKKNLERQIEGLEREISQKRERLQVLEREMEGLQAEANLFKERLLKEYKLSAEHETPPFALSEKELEEKRLEANLRLEKLGQVNLGAIEEYEEIKERYEFLKTQREDLRASIRALQKAIRTIDQTSTKLFLSTLEKANQNFKRLLQFIFGEAKGEIVLLDPAHPLTSGVDFKVQLPGKKVRHHLFSMGERSLISLIFLFGLYFIKPSPFCILDEVDAGLDERNVERFCNLLKQLKDTMQLIVITHHRRVMEAADQLIGVTMEQKGVSSIVSISLEGGEKNVQVV